MSQQLIAAERRWFAIAPDGSEHEIVIRVGAPKPQPGGEWSASISLGSLDAHIYEIAGIDGWQAVTLAMRYATTRLGHFAEEDWRFYWDRGGELTTPGDLET